MKSKIIKLAAITLSSCVCQFAIAQNDVMNAAKTVSPATTAATSASKVATTTQAASQAVTAASASKAQSANAASANTVAKVVSTNSTMSTNVGKSATTTLDAGPNSPGVNGLSPNNSMQTSAVNSTKSKVSDMNGNANGRLNNTTGKTVQAQNTITNNAKQAVNNRPSLKGSNSTGTIAGKNGNPAYQGPPIPAGKASNSNKLSSTPAVTNKTTTASGKNGNPAYQGPPIPAGKGSTSGNTSTKTRVNSSSKGNGGPYTDPDGTTHTPPTIPPAQQQFQKPNKGGQ